MGYMKNCLIERATKTTAQVYTARPLAAQSAVHLPTASHMWKDGSSRVTIQRVRLTAFPTAFLNETDLIPLMLSGTISLIYTKGSAQLCPHCFYTY